MFVEVRPIDHKKWHGKKGKDTFAMPKVVEALFDEKTGKLATGLTIEDEVKYGKLLSVDLSATFSPETAHPFWSTKPAMIKLENNTMILNTDKPLDYIRVKLMRASKLVANSLKELEDGKWPDSTHVIYDEEAEVTLKAGKVQAKQKAYAVVSKMSNDDKTNMVMILSNKSIKGRSTDFIDVEIDSILEEKPVEFMRYFSMGRDEVYARSSILEAIHKGILTEDSNSVFYMSEMIGIDRDAAVEWFKNPNNQKMKIAIVEKLTSLTK